VNRIFVVDDETAMGENIQRMVKFPDTAVTPYTDPIKALADALARPPDLMLLDMKMPGMSGEEVFARLHQAHPGVPIVFLTGFGSVEGAVLAIRNGAFDYLQKPFKREDLLLVVKRALAHAELEHEVDRLKGRLEALGESDHPQSRSAIMRELTEKARRAATTEATVMILGESGTGKEVMARFIQSQSPRKNRPFVPVDCSAMPGSLIERELFGYERGAFTGGDRATKGLIESADGGTLFLDEIGDLNVALQTRLFRFVEE
jgi:two-component system response regulator AtoC